MQLISFLLVAFTLLLGSSLVVEGHGTGELTFHQSCNPSASLHDDPGTRCDTSKRLSCDMKTRTCVCHHEERDFYNKANDRCETKIGKFCSPSETFPTICAANAFCDTKNFCVCKEGATENEDMTVCIQEEMLEENSASISKSVYHHFIYIFIALSIIGCWV